MIERRNFLRGLAAAPVMVAAVASAGPVPTNKPGGIRISCEKDDPGYRQFCIYNGDGKIPKIYLDDVEQKQCMTADESTGMVKRVVMTPNGNIAHGPDGILNEEVYGRVEIKLVDKPTSKGAC